MDNSLEFSWWLYYAQEHLLKNNVPFSGVLKNMKYIKNINNTFFVRNILKVLSRDKTNM